MITETEALALVKAKKLRMVGSARKRKLRRRGVSVRWMQVLNSYVWEPDY